MHRFGGNLGQKIVSWAGLLSRAPFPDWLGWRVKPPYGPCEAFETLGILIVSQGRFEDLKRYHEDSIRSCRVEYVENPFLNSWR